MKYEMEEVLAALKKHKGNRSRAARELGVSHRDLLRILERLGVRNQVDMQWPPRQGRPPAES